MGPPSSPLSSTACVGRPRMRSIRYSLALRSGAARRRRFFTTTSSSAGLSGKTRLSNSPEPVVTRAAGAYSTSSS